MLDFILITACTMLMSINRRVDGMDAKDLPHFSWYIVNGNIHINTDNARAILVRVIPVAVMVLLVVYFFCTGWREWVVGLVFGAVTSASLQAKYDDWTKFSARQIFRMWPVMLAYLPMGIYSPILSACGVICSLLAGLVRPIMARTFVTRYTVFSEYAEGALMCLPFFVILI